MTYPIRIHPGSRQSPRATEPTRLIHPNRRRLIPIDLLKRDGGDPPQPKVHVHSVHRSTKTGLFGQSLHGTLLSMLFLPDDHPDHLLYDSPRKRSRSISDDSGNDNDQNSCRVNAFASPLRNVSRHPCLPALICQH
jgi:hypothetical protein